MANSSFFQVQTVATAQLIWEREQILLPKRCFILGYQAMYSPETEQSYHMPPTIVIKDGCAATAQRWI